MPTSRSSARAVGSRPALPNTIRPTTPGNTSMHEAVDGARPRDDEGYPAVIEVHSVILARR